jgi:hypothetical protein
MLIKLKIEYHSGNFIPIAFRSGEFRGTFRYQFRNARIPPERETTGMAVLAEPSANFHSSGIHRNPPESPESGRNQWGITKTSHWGSVMWRCWALVELTSSPGIGPQVGNHWGARRRQWRPRIMVVDGGWWWMVVVVVRGKMRQSQCVTWVMFQPWLLDLATHGRLLLINGNYH